MSESKCFAAEKPKYSTNGVSEHVPLLYQMAIWEQLEILNRKKDFELDYFQVFELKVVTVNGKKVQKMTHKQEKPEYEKEFVIPIEGDGLTDKIFVIDDVSHATMLFAREY